MNVFANGLLGIVDGVKSSKWAWPFKKQFEKRSCQFHDVIKYDCLLTVGELVVRSILLHISCVCVLVKINLRWLRGWWSMTIKHCSSMAFANNSNVLSHSFLYLSWWDGGLTSVDYYPLSQHYLVFKNGFEAYGWSFALPLENKWTHLVSHWELLPVGF